MMVVIYLSKVNDLTPEEQNTLLEMFDKKLDDIERDPERIRKAQMFHRRVSHLSAEDLNRRFG